MELAVDLRLPGAEDPAGSSAPPPLLTHIPALDGARGIAVALVLGYHFGVPGLGGGFLGVDLFFVLSGFLITTLLFSEFATDDGIDLVRFWLRRARRLLPALFLLVAVCAAYASTTSPYDRGPLRWDLVSSIFYVANWRFIASGQSYFAEYAAASPVRHLWSLAIEEQFYVVWPIIILAALVVLRRVRGVRAGQVAFVLLTAAIAASALMLALTWSDTDPSLAYYNTLTRAHELLIGAGGAAILFYKPAWRGWIRRHAGVLATAGLAVVLLAGITLTDSDRGYYFGGSLLFSLAGLLLVIAIVADGRGDAPVLRALGWKPLAWLGAVSYGVYLWHWPIALWLTPASTGLDGTPLLAARVGATLLIAAVSFYVVEQPIRRGRLGRLRLEARVAFPAAAVIAIALAGVTVLGTRGAKPLPAFLQGNMQIVASVQRSPVGSVAIVGDSVAMSLYPGLVHEGAARGWDVASATFPGCAMGDTLRLDADSALFWNARSCARNTVAKQAALIARYRPTLVFWHGGRDRFDIQQDGRTLKAGTDEWQAALIADWDRTLARLTSGGAKVVLVLPIPSEGATPHRCRTEAGRTDPSCAPANIWSGPLGRLYRQWAATHADRVTVVDLSDALCPTDPCPATLDGVDLRTDKVHLTTEGAVLAARRLLQAVPPALMP